ncbi:acyl carrier protein, partial [Nocardia sp. NPDC050697]|uniref:acyl carrier protein n=1 Tax=Nocardia sp. NPDC050697 TaxID=3155158 RepID=UPI0033F01687
PTVVAARLDQTALKAQARTTGLAPIWRQVITTPRRVAIGGDGAAVSVLRQRLNGLSRPEQLHVVLELVRTQVALVLGHEGPDAITADRNFRDLGFDSLTAVEIRNRLNLATELRLPATLVFDYPTPDTVADHILYAITGQGFEGEDRIFEGDLSEQKVRELLQSIPIRRLKDSGVLGTLLSISREEETQVESPNENSQSIADLDVEGLINRALYGLDAE